MKATARVRELGFAPKACLLSELTDLGDLANLNLKFPAQFCCEEEEDSFRKRSDTVSEDRLQGSSAPGS